MLQPIVTRKDYQLLNIDEENYLTMLDDKSDQRADLRIDPDDDDIHKKLKEEFDDGKDLTVTVLAAMSTEKVIAFKENQ
jgi:translation initiation factor 5A